MEPQAGETGIPGAEGVTTPQTLRQKDPCGAPGGTRRKALWRAGPGAGLAEGTGGSSKAGRR